MLKSCCRVVEFISGKAALTAEATSSPQTPDPYVPGCRLPEIGIHLRNHYQLLATTDASELNT